MKSYAQSCYFLLLPAMCWLINQSTNTYIHTYIIQYIVIWVLLWNFLGTVGMVESVLAFLVYHASVGRQILPEHFSKEFKDRGNFICADASI